MAAARQFDLVGTWPDVEQPELYKNPESDTAHIEDGEMTQRRLNEDEIRMIAQASRELAPTQPNKQTNILLGVIALATLIGGAGNFLATMGLAVGNKQATYDNAIKQAEKDHDRLENLRTLYMLRFGEDPDKVDIQARQQEAERQRLHQQERDRQRR